MVFGIIVVVVLYLISIYNLTIAILGLFPGFRDTAIGTLHKSNTRRNVPTRHGITKIPIVTSYTYKYKVNGREYSRSGTVYYSKRCLYKKATMVFVKGFPRHAYLEKFVGTNQWLAGIFTLVMGSMFVIAMVLS